MQTVPEHILKLWREQAADNQPLRRSHHRYQQWGYKHAGPYEDCWHCQRAVAKCKSKIRHESVEAAWAHCIEAWPEKELATYRCFWTDGLHWHAKRVKSTNDRRKLRKRIVRGLAKPNIEP